LLIEKLCEITGCKFSLGGGGEKMILQTESGFSGEFTDDVAHHTGPLTPLNKIV